MKDWITDPFLSKIILLVAATFLLLDFTEIVLSFDQFLESPVAFLASLIRENFHTLRFVPVVIAIPILLIPLFVYTDKSDSGWLIKRNRRLIAYVNIANWRKCTVLNRIYIAHPYRRKGIGSALIRYFLQQSAVPMYVFFWGHGVEGFYTQLGFVPAKERARSENVIDPEIDIGLVLMP